MATKQAAYSDWGKAATTKYFGDWGGKSYTNTLDIFGKKLRRPP
jgi:hypothetical protein